MDLKAGWGSAWGIPLGGGIVSITGADASAILSAASGLARSLAAIAGGGIAIAMGLVGLYLYLKSKRDPLPFSVMADVRSHSRSFKGVCLDERLAFECEWSGGCFAGSGPVLAPVTCCR